MQNTRIWYSRPRPVCTPLLRPTGLNTGSWQNRLDIGYHVPIFWIDLNLYSYVYINCCTKYVYTWKLKQMVDILLMTLDGTFSWQNLTWLHRRLFSIIHKLLKMVWDLANEPCWPIYWRMYTSLGFDGWIKTLSWGAHLAICYVIYYIRYARVLFRNLL